MATVTKGKTFGSTETVTAAKLHQLVDSATVTGIVNADIAAGAAIASTKLDSTTAGYITTGGNFTVTGTYTFSTAPVLPADTVDAITEIKSTLKSGSDTTLITGTKGTENYTAKWNGDGDLVDGYEVLDEDDMNSDSATKLATQQSIKAYVDGVSSIIKVVGYEGDGQDDRTVAHGLGRTPVLVILTRDSDEQDTNDASIWMTGMGTGCMCLTDGGYKADYIKAVDGTNVTVGDNANVNGNGKDFILVAI